MNVRAFCKAATVKLVFSVTFTPPHATLVSSVMQLDHASFGSDQLREGLRDFV